MLRVLALALLFAGLGATTALAQEDEGSAAMDEEARLVFQAGTVAFEDARYEEALERFRTAYELSGRTQLLYNIGVSADRLRRDEEALVAFEQFIAESPADADGVRDAEARVEVLRSRQTSAGGAGEGLGDEQDDQDESADEDSGGRAILGPVLVGVAGLGLVAVPVVGALTAGCTMTSGDVCVEEQQLDAGMAGLFIGLGVAVLTVAVIWFLVSGPDNDDSDDATAWFVPGEMAVRF